jgi:hypothetical protein
VAFLEGDNLVVFYFLRAPEICPNKQGALSGGETIAVFYYMCASDICSGKRGGFHWGGQFIAIVFCSFIASEIWPDNKEGVVFGRRGLIRRGIL